MNFSFSQYNNTCVSSFNDVWEFEHAITRLSVDNEYSLIDFPVDSLSSWSEDKFWLFNFGWPK
jgi:hypothetical protein